MMFEPRVVEAIRRGIDGPQPTGAMRAVLPGGTGGTIPGRRLDRVGSGTGGRTDDGDHDHVVADDKILRDRLQRAMTRGAGVLRDAESLEATMAVVRTTTRRIDDLPDGVAREELRNLVTVAAAMLDAATAREESRGCHTRSDFPDTEPAFLVRLVV
jgi:L-aspartate oxidase